jgi:hypothetical protein
MYQANWSWWDLVAVGGVAWTFVSFLFAFALGRVLRANRVFETDMAMESKAPLAPRPEVETVPVIVTMVQTSSLLDQLLPADLADEGAENESRSSGTRFRPVAGENAEAPVMPRIRNIR